MESKIYFLALTIYILRFIFSIEMTEVEDFFHPNNTQNLTLEKCFENFDKNQKNRLNFEDFQKLCSELFLDGTGQKYDLEISKIKEMFSIFDKNKDNFLDKDEFKNCWEKWLKIILKPKTALLIIDVQNDFITGSLSISKCPAGENGADVITPINYLLEKNWFDAIFYSFDWHPENHISFVENVKLRKIDPESGVMAENIKPFDDVIFLDQKSNSKIVQKVFPKHCVQNSWGASLHKDLKIPESSIKIFKGNNPEVDSYSAFFDNQKISQTNLNNELKKFEITDLFVCGIAWDFCVGSSALHSLELGYRTVVLEDCVRGIDNSGIENMKQKIKNENGVILNSEKVAGMIKGLDRNPILAYKLACDLKNNN